MARSTPPSPLARTLARHTTAGSLCRVIDGKPDWIHCYACGHNCAIPPGQPGICKVRFNDSGVLQVPHGYAAAVQVDPVEKKPFFHVRPGAAAMSFGMLGCDYHCGYCQNWITSQALRDPDAVAPIETCSAEDLVQLAQRHQAQVLVSTYNEPLITSEWAVDVFRAARQHGNLLTGYVSNGNATPEVLDYLRPVTDLYKVDLKSFRDPAYRQLGGLLQTVLDTIQGLVEREFWVEVVTLIVPGFNDSDEELGDIARFLAGVSVDIPWHVTAFHQDYKMTEPDPTPVQSLRRAVAIGRDAGLHFVYAGNRPGQIEGAENTYCPSCRTVLVERSGYRILKTNLNGSSCPGCDTKIPGVWR